MSEKIDESIHRAAADYVSGCGSETVTCEYNAFISGYQTCELLDKHALDAANAEIAQLEEYLKIDGEREIQLCKSLKEERDKNADLIEALQTIAGYENRQGNIAARALARMNKEQK